jgi:hypothetical protein
VGVVHDHVEDGGMSAQEPVTPDDYPPSAGKSLHGSVKTQKTPSLIECNGCPNAWTGLSACHCSGCHRTFTGITAFDIHRSGDTCVPPATIFTEKGEPRLVPAEKLYWSGWGLPGEKPVGELL